MCAYHHNLQQCSVFNINNMTNKRRYYRCMPEQQTEHLRNTISLCNMAFNSLIKITRNSITFIIIIVVSRQSDLQQGRPVTYKHAIKQTIKHIMFTVQCLVVVMLCCVFRSSMFASLRRSSC